MVQQIAPESWIQTVREGGEGQAKGPWLQAEQKCMDPLARVYTRELALRILSVCVTPSGPDVIRLHQIEFVLIT